MNDQYTDFFCPPLWRQRRIFIQEALTRFKAGSVLDYGCGEAAVLSFLIPESTFPIQKLAGIDICDQVLTEAIDRCTPWSCDFSHLRTYPLSIDIYKGSIGDPDARFMNFDAIICTEVIEHVFPDVLDTFLPLTLGTYQPRVMIVTTPNGEYNVYFPDLKYGTDQSIFRHDDHKFEWTRQQFEDWCEEGAKKYNYDVEFHGIGLLHGKENELAYGHCTQACIFTRREKKPVLTPLSQPHQLLTHLEFPFYNDPPPPDTEIMQEIEYYLKALCISESKLRESHLPKSSSTATAAGQEEEDQTLVIDPAMDWSTFQLEKVIVSSVMTEEGARIESKPQEMIKLPITSLWMISRIQHLCKTQDTLCAYLRTLDPHHYEIQSDFICVKHFQPENEEEDSQSVFSDDT
ncbi:hypothetical protein INT47_003262, partial [Mucor saturninus]